jgi:2-keto-4-pentenoate hydratase/2-oxohepta-3-ene-1,7-dioic acid hydratase in catechol pathway
MKILISILGVIFSFNCSAQIEYFARFVHKQQISFGRIVGDRIEPITGSLFSEEINYNPPIALSSVKLLTPTTPQKVFAVGMNFASHMASSSMSPPPLFLKLPSSLIASGKVIHLPKDAKNVHFEGELVLVIGKRAKNITEAEASKVIFAVTAGNDLTERSWQGSDLQWMRAKASDGFGPIATRIAKGVDYNNVLLTTRLNGKIVQQENTRNMIHSPAKVVSYLSQYFTLEPGDLIFMGTPGRTQALTDGDKVSVSIDKVATVESVISK